MKDCPDCLDLVIQIITPLAIINLLGTALILFSMRCGKYIFKGSKDNEYETDPDKIERYYLIHDPSEVESESSIEVDPPIESESSVESELSIEIDPPIESELPIEDKNIIDQVRNNRLISCGEHDIQNISNRSLIKENQISYGSEQDIPIGVLRRREFCFVTGDKDRDVVNLVNSITNLDEHTSRTSLNVIAGDRVLLEKITEVLYDEIQTNDESIRTIETITRSLCSDLPMDKESLDMMTKTLLSATDSLAKTLNITSGIPDIKKRELSSLLDGVPKLINKIAYINGSSNTISDKESDFLVKTLDALRA